ENPGLDARAVLEASDCVEHCDPSILDHFFCRASIAEEDHRKTQKRVLIAIHQLREGEPVASAKALEQERVGSCPCGRSWEEVACYPSPGNTHEDDPFWFRKAPTMQAPRQLSNECKSASWVAPTSPGCQFSDNSVDD